MPWRVLAGFRTKYMDPDIIYKAACVAFDR